MKSAVLAEPKKFTIKEIEPPIPKNEELRIRLEGCGVCGSNVPVWQGREWFNYPQEPGLPGHESYGIVESVGEKVRTLKIGDRVASLVPDAFKEYILAKEDEVVRIPYALKDFPFTGEPLGCAMNIFKRSDIKKGDSVAVVGIGFLGAVLTELAKNAGAYVIAVSRREYSLKIAKELGADEVIKLDENWNVINKVSELTDGEMCDKVIEAVGKQQTLDLAGELTKVRGKLIIAGFHQDGLRQVNMQSWNWKGIDVVNAHERDQKIYLQGMQDAVDAISNDQLHPKKLFSFYPLEKINEAFNDLENRPEGFIKAVITYDN